MRCYRNIVSSSLQLLIAASLRATHLTNIFNTSSTLLPAMLPGNCLSYNHSSYHQNLEPLQHTISSHDDTEVPYWIQMNKPETLVDVDRQSTTGPTVYKATTDPEAPHQSHEDPPLKKPGGEEPLDSSHLANAYRFIKVFGRSKNESAQIAKVALDTVDSKDIGVVLINLGSPHAATYFSVYNYLREFLSDPRVIELPRVLWNAVLYGYILPFRSRSSSLRYARIMTEGDSPLLKCMNSLGDKLENRLIAEHRTGRAIKVKVGMRYGQPSIATALRELRIQGIRNILILPLYPQVASSSVSTAYDAVFKELLQWRTIPNLRTVVGYADHPVYIKKLADTIVEFWKRNKRGDVMLISFHGIPASLTAKGEIYYLNCIKTTQLLVKQLQLKEGEYRMVFQSRLGSSEWLQPYIDDVLVEIAESAPNTVIDVICPGFSCDCLETLEEVDGEYKSTFSSLTNNKGELRRIPCLNDSVESLDLIAALVKENIGDWMHPNT